MAVLCPQEEYPVNRVLSSKKPLKNYVLGIYNGAQNLTWVLVNAYPEFEENGKIKQIVITFINITKRKQAEEEIKQTRNFLQALLDHLPVAVFVKNANPDHFGVIQFWNKTSEQLFGISAEQAIGQTVYEFFPVEQASFFDQKDREAFLKGEIEDIPEELIDSYSLGRRWLHTVKVPVYNEQHQPQYLLCFSEDITERKRVQAERLELTQVMENALSGISKLDTQGCYVYVNKTYANIAGYQPEEMIGISWQKTVHPDELEKMIAAYQQMVKIGRVEVETTGIRKDGSIFYKELVMIASYDEDRQLLGHYCFMKDISERQAALRERKQAEMNLAQELLRTQTLFNTSIDGIVVMNNQGDVVQASTSFAQMLGYSLEEALTLNVVDWDAQWTKEELEIMLAREEVIPLFETRHRRKDGSEYDVEISWNRVELDGEMMNFCICRNISERKQIEEALQYQKEIFQTIVNNIPVMITLFNSKGQIELINPELERVLGWPLETWQQKDILSKCYPDPVYCESVLEHMLAANGKWKDMTTLTATGEKIETSWANVRLSSGYCLGIGQDITERKQKELTLQQAMETAEAANLAKSLFLANMSHELRTPLNVILGFAQVMAHDSALTPAQKQDLQTIQRSGDHLLSLINDVLDLSKIESGHCTLDETGFDLIALLHSLRNMLAERASSKGLDLSFEIAPEVPQFIIADAQKLRQVLINLISNGIKFTEKGMVTLRVKSQEFTQINTLIFEVEDTGVGISQEELETIFDAFVQATAGKRSVSGTGLGLTISRKLVELMGGKISVRSKIGKGSLFTFSLPVCLTNGVDLTPEQSDRQVIALVPGQPHHRILVVDDRAENRLLMVRLLEQLGLEVYQASNGQEAVQLWKQWLPDLIWMDIRMPILDGYEATKQIRAMEQGQKSIIIALTAQASHSDRALALAAGCNDYISKPFREQTLFIKMGEYLGLQYIYQEQKTGYSDGGKESFTGNLLKGKSENNTSKPDINLTLLAKLPGAWLTQLEDAAICGNDLAIAELVEQLSPEFARLGTRLTELANQYQFEKIIDLISSRVSEKLTTEIESSFSTVSD
ncbi:PAS domain S-box protein [Capilliphycus salinus ALCB114379]|uniref:PAS domain-containing hybrid sensor histidine kinase/response regulator n=1 Tax=Capilliphycus salinus TaxID=2768948 RepID=UPI0039A40EEA